MNDAAEDIGIRVQNGEHKAWVHRCTYYGSAVYHKRTDNYCLLCRKHWADDTDVEMPEKLKRSEEWK